MGVSNLATTAKKDDAPYYLQVLLGMLPLLLGVQLLAWLIILPPALKGHADFRQLYAAGYMVRSGHARELYDYGAQLRFQNQLVSTAQVPLPFIRPAYYALLFVPFSLLSYRDAYLFFLGSNLILLCISYRMLHPWIQNLTAVWSWLPALVFAGFFPVAAAFLQGQDSILLLTLLVAAFVCFHRGSDFHAGVLTGLGLFKFQIAIPVALFFIVWRRWRSVAGFAITALGAATLSVSLVGLAQSERYARSLVAMNTGLPARANDLSYPIPTQFMANLHGLLVGVANGHFRAFWVNVVAIVLSGLVWLWVARATRGRGLPDETFPIAIAASVVVSYYLFLYDLSVLLIPLVLLLDRLTQSRFTEERGDRLAGWTALLAFVAPLFDPFFPRYRFLLALPVCALLWVLVREGRRIEPTQEAGGTRGPAGNVKPRAATEAR